VNNAHVQNTILKKKRKGIDEIPKIKLEKKI